MTSISPSNVFMCTCALFMVSKAHAELILKGSIPKIALTKGLFLPSICFIKESGILALVQVIIVLKYIPWKTSTLGCSAGMF